MWKIAAVSITALNLFYAYLVYTGAEVNTSAVIGDQFIISALVLFIAFTRD